MTKRKTLAKEPRNYPSERDLVNTLIELEIEAGLLGFYRTMHKLNEAKQELGWEMARDPKGRDAYARHANR